MKKSFKGKQKIINRLVRQINKALEEDQAFYGRIYLRQFSAGWNDFADGSGGMWFGVIRIYDKVTNTYKSVIGNIYEVQRTLFVEVNDFIVYDLQIDVHKALALAVDYRSVPHNPRDAEPFYPYYEKNYSYKQYQL